MLAYLAVFRRPGSPGDAPPERMYISSLWQCFAQGWLNVFSQDTPAAPASRQEVPDAHTKSHE